MSDKFSLPLKDALGYYADICKKGSKCTISEHLLFAILVQAEKTNVLLLEITKRGEGKSGPAGKSPPSKVVPMNR